MKKVNTITPQFIASLVRNKGGNYQIPDDYALYRKQTTQERRQERIKKLEDDLKNMTEPTEEELIMEGRMMHPYYMLNHELEHYKNK